MSNVQVWVGGSCNTTFNLPPFSSTLARSPLAFRGAITEDLCAGPGCVFQETAAEGDADLTDEYAANCAAGGGEYTLKTEHAGDQTLYRIGWCAAGSGGGDALDRIGEAMEGSERSSVWCSSHSAAGRTAGPPGPGWKWAVLLGALGLVGSVGGWM